MAHYMLCIDGMEESGLELPHVPQENLLAVGTVETAPMGASVDSLGCILRILGLQENELPYGRAVIEAQAIGLIPEENDLYLRCTLCNIDHQNRLVSPANLHSSAMHELLTTLQKQLEDHWTLYPLSGYRAILRIKQGKQLLTDLSTIPPHQRFSHPLDQCLPCGGVLGPPLADMVYESMNIHPKCALLPWGESYRREFVDFHTRMGVQGAIVCRTEIVQGISAALHMGCPTVANTTADIDTDLTEKLHAALHIGKTCPFVMIHVNGCDEAAHRQNQDQKVAFRNAIIQKILLPLLEQKQADEKILLCSDHKTSSKTGAHEPGAVHFWLYGEKSKTKQYEFQNSDALIRMLLHRGGI